MNGYKIVPSKYISSRGGVNGEVIQNFNEIDSMRVKKVYKSDWDVMKLFIERYERVHGISLEDVLKNQEHVGVSK